MTVTEPVEIALMIFRRPSDTFAKFRERPPLLMTIALYFLIWAGVSSYIYSYLSSESDAAKLKQYLTFAMTGFGAVFAGFVVFSAMLFMNARIVFGKGSFGAAFTACFYSFLTVTLLLAVPVQVASFLFVPPEYEYWFSIVTRSGIISYYFFLLVIATARIFEISLARSAVAVIAIFAYFGAFAGSALYFAKTFGVRLF